MKYLFVVAHPDDEVLGAGGMIYDLIKKKNDIFVCIMCSDVEARTHVLNKGSIREQSINSLSILGVPKENIIFGTFPNIKLNIVDHLSLVQFIENALRKFKPDVVITHYSNDINIDHKITSECSDEAIRLFQRGDNGIDIKKYMYMEVLSSTDWMINQAFAPNYFYEINKDGLEMMIKALSKYDGAIREYPHPRSKESITSLATYRGSQARLNYAEAFIIAFDRDKNE